MTISSTLARYLARSYLFNLLSMLFVLLAIIYLFDTVELLRRASSKDQTSLGLILQMGLLKMPEVGQIVFPFAVLFSAIYTFWQLTKRYELVVVRAAGFSVWQFLGPVLGTAVLVGIINVGLVNPMGAMLLKKFERLEDQYLSSQQSYVTLLKEGIWLRQVEEDGEVIMHAGRIQLPEWKLRKVMVLFFNKQNDFVRRIDADNARIEDGMWVFEEVLSNTLDGASEKIPLLALQTNLTTQELEESFSSPETISFWALPDFIRTMEVTGFDATTLRIHFQSLLAQPLLFAAMVLLAAVVSLRPPREQGAFKFLVIGIAIGFLVFFLSSYLKALGASHQLPVILSAWAPAIVTALIGVTIMLGQEDG